MKNTLLALIVVAAGSLSACQNTQKCSSSTVTAVDGKGVVAPVKTDKCCKKK